MKKLLRFAILIFALFSLTPGFAQSIKVTLLGTGTPILNIRRFGISTLVEAGNQRLLFDAGRGVAMRLHQTQVPLSDLSAIFLSLMNSDHVTGLADIYADAPLPTDGGRRKTPLVLYGPDGVQNVASGLQLMLHDNNRLRLLAQETNPQAIKIDAHLVKPGIVYRRGGVTVSAFLIEHGVTKPDYGYRVEYGGHAIVITDDTSYSQNLVDHARNADLMIQSVAIGSRELEQAYPAYVNHFYAYLANPEMVGRILSETKPKLAVLAHISLYSRSNIPRANNEELKQRIAARYTGSFVIGEDLMSFVVDNDGVHPQTYNADAICAEPTPR